MKLTDVHFNDDEEPVTMAFVMTTEEAAAIYGMFGHTATSVLDDELPRGAGGSIATCVGNVFNMFYENGVDDVHNFSGGNWVKK